MIEPTQQQELVDDQVAKGIVKEPAEVQHEYAQLQIAIGRVERGEYGPLDIDDIKRRGRERYE